MNLNDATVFITGANRGIGHALIAELRQRGVRRIYATTRKPEISKEVPSTASIPARSTPT